MKNKRKIEWVDDLIPGFNYLESLPDYEEQDDSEVEEVEEVREASRYNDGKPQISYLGDIKEALEILANVFEMGADKYGRDNWKKGFNKKTMLDSMGRHYLKLAAGQELDEESGLDHAAHLAWNALAYMQLKAEGSLFDE